ncbi:MAG TPA: hypothetical protein VKE98_21590, partial [Gemmataceae bacterium]|nr:hypothetical protein [Gemmataceae bacterium]
MVASSIIILAGVCFTGAGEEKRAARAIDVKIINYDEGKCHKFDSGGKRGCDRRTTWKCGPICL